MCFPAHAVLTLDVRCLILNVWLMFLMVSVCFIHASSALLGLFCSVLFVVDRGSKEIEV